MVEVTLTPEKGGCSITFFNKVVEALIEEYGEKEVNQDELNYLIYQISLIEAYYLAIKRLSDVYATHPKPEGGRAGITATEGDGE